MLLCVPFKLRIFKPLGVLVLLLGSIVAFFSFYLTPTSLAKGYSLEQEYRQSNEVSGVVTGRFTEARSGTTVYFVEDYNSESGFYENVFAYSKSFEREGVVVSKNAYRMEDEKTQDQFLVLVNGSRYEGVPGSPDYRVVDFERYAIRIEPKNQTKLALPIRSRPNAELRASSDPKFISEWYWRIAKVFTLPVLAIFALALCQVDTRRGKANGMVLSFLVYLTYTNLLAYTVAMVKRGESADGTPIWTHKVDGLTLWDFVLAAKIDEL